MTTHYVVIPEAQRRQRRWYVWRTDHLDGQLFGERRLVPAFKEYPGVDWLGFVPPRLHPGEATRHAGPCPGRVT